MNQKGSATKQMITINNFNEKRKKSEWSCQHIEYLFLFLYFPPHRWMFADIQDTVTIDGGRTERALFRKGDE